MLEPLHQPGPLQPRQPVHHGLLAAPGQSPQAVQRRAELATSALAAPGNGLKQHQIARGDHPAAQQFAGILHHSLHQSPPRRDRPSRTQLPTPRKGLQSAR